MSDPAASPISSRDPSWEAYAETHAAQEALDAGQRSANKVTVFAALAVAGISHVLVAFDGSGDSGQIEGINARAGKEPIDFPTATLSFLYAAWGVPDPVARDVPLADAIEQLAYDYLGDTHAGWENNDGAYGEFVFDVAAGTIILDYNDRYTTVESYSHSF